MTREEAKRIAQGLITDFKCESQTMVEFCNVVIEALEQESCEDCISRTEVIKLIDEREDVNGKVDAESVRTDIVLIPPVNPQPCENAIGRSDMLDAIGHGTTYTSEELQRIIKGLPPMNPQAKTGQWIPVSERMPEEDGQYLITVKYKHVNDSYEDVYAEHGEWYDGRWDMFCFGHCGEVEEIIAWMPLPAPYEPQESEDEG